MNTRQQIAKAVEGLAAYYRQELPEVVQTVLVRELGKYDLEAVKEAIGRHLSDPERGRYMPLLADLLAYLGPSLDARAQAAWDQAIGALRRHGTYAGVCFADGRIAVAIQRMGGWGALGRSQEADLPFRQRDFVARWSAMAKDVTAEPLPPGHLPGVYGFDVVHYVGFAPDQPRPALPAPEIQGLIGQMASALVRRA